MHVKIIGVAIALVVVMFVSWSFSGGSGVASAHVHPLVPFECATSSNAGNVSDPRNDEGPNAGGPGQGTNGQDFIPGFIPVDNPGGANVDLPLSAVTRPAPIAVGGPGVGPATENCANTQP